MQYLIVFIMVKKMNNNYITVAALTRYIKYKIDNDMVNYEIIVHALKSNCRTLGFTSTGEMFYQHELASKSGNNTWVNENYNALIEEVNRVYKILMTYKGME